MILILNLQFDLRFDFFGGLLEQERRLKRLDEKLYKALLERLSKQQLTPS